jgi:glycerol-3-phosphate acyltransferase PlsY
MLDWLLVPLAYFFGSLSTAIVVCRMWGLPDPREQGSKNPGATNVLRLGGKKAAAITLAGDALKGFVPVLIAKSFAVGPLILGGVGLAAFLGHLFPVFFGFKGGKGVATAFGVLSGFSIWVGSAVLATWIAVAAVSRISSLSALVAAVLAPGYVWYFSHSESLAGAAFFMAILLIVRHRENIARLLRGEESRIGRKA